MKAHRLGDEGPKVTGPLWSHHFQIQVSTGESLPLKYISAGEEPKSRRGNYYLVKRTPQVKSELLLVSFLAGISRGCFKNRWYCGFCWCHLLVGNAVCQKEQGI